MPNPWPSAALLLVVLVFWFERRLLGGSATLPFSGFRQAFLCSCVCAPLFALLLQRFAMAFISPQLMSWSVGPAIEEFAKAAPVLILVFGYGGARYLTVADITLLGLASGLGFSFVEQNLRLLASNWHKIGALQFQHLFEGGFNPQNWQWGYSFSGHATAAAAVALAAALGVRFSKRPVYSWILVGVALAMVSFDHGMNNWKVEHTNSFFGHIESVDQAPPAIERIYLFTLHGLVETIFVPLGLLLGSWAEGIRFRRTIGYRPDLLLPAETRPLVLSEWLIALSRLRLGRLPFFQTLAYFRRRRSYALLRTEGERAPESITPARRIEARLLEDHTYIVDPPPSDWIPPRKLWPRMIADWLKRFRWVLVSRILIIVVFMLGPWLPENVASVIYGTYFPLVLAALGFLVLWPALRGFFKQPKFDPGRATGETLATRYFRALLLGSSVVSSVLGVLNIFLRGNLLSGHAIANITDAVGNWGGNPGTLAGLAPFVATNPDRKPPCDDLRQEVQKGEQRLQELQRQRADLEWDDVLKAPEPNPDKGKLMEDGQSFPIPPSFDDTHLDAAAAKWARQQGLVHQSGNDQIAVSGAQPLAADTGSTPDSTAGNLPVNNQSFPVPPSFDDRHLNEAAARWAQEHGLVPEAGQQQGAASGGRQRASGGRRPARDPLGERDQQIETEKKAQSARAAALAVCEKRARTAQRPPVMKANLDDLQRQIDAAKRQFEELERQLQDAVQKDLQSIQDFVQKYDALMKESARAADDYLREWKALLPDYQKILDVLKARADFAPVWDALDLGSQLLHFDPLSLATDGVGAVKSLLVGAMDAQRAREVEAAIEAQERLAASLKPIESAGSEVRAVEGGVETANVVGQVEKGENVVAGAGEIAGVGGVGAEVEQAGAAERTAARAGGERPPESLPGEGRLSSPDGEGTAGAGEEPARVETQKPAVEGNPTEAGAEGAAKGAEEQPRVESPKPTEGEPIRPSEQPTPEQPAQRVPGEESAPVKAEGEGSAPNSGTEHALEPQLQGPAIEQRPPVRAEGERPTPNAAERATPAPQPERVPAEERAATAAGEQGPASRSTEGSASQAAPDAQRPAAERPVPQTQGEGTGAPTEAPASRPTTEEPQAPTEEHMPTRAEGEQPVSSSGEQHAETSAQRPPAQEYPAPTGQGERSATAAGEGRAARSEMDTQQVAPREGSPSEAEPAGRGSDTDVGRPNDEQLEQMQARHAGGEEPATGERSAEAIGNQPPAGGFSDSEIRDLRGASDSGGTDVGPASESQLEEMRAHHEEELERQLQDIRDGEPRTPRIEQIRTQTGESMEQVLNRLENERSLTGTAYDPSVAEINMKTAQQQLEHLAEGDWTAAGFQNPPTVQQVNGIFNQYQDAVNTMQEGQELIGDGFWSRMPAEQANYLRQEVEGFDPAMRQQWLDRINTGYTFNPEAITQGPPGRTFDPTEPRFPNFDPERPPEFQTQRVDMEGGPRTAPYHGDSGFGSEQLPDTARPTTDSVEPRPTPETAARAPNQVSGPFRDLTLEQARNLATDAVDKNLARGGKGAIFVNDPHTLANVSQIRWDDKQFTLIVHGSPDGKTVVIEHYGVLQKYTPEEFVEMIQDPDQVKAFGLGEVYNGGPIRLVSCYGASAGEGGVAARFSEIFDTDVDAIGGKIRVSEGGGIFFERGGVTHFSGGKLIPKVPPQ